MCCTCSLAYFLFFDSGTAFTAVHESFLLFGGMNWDFMFFFNSVLLGVGLAMDAFSVSMENGLNEPKMSKGKMCGVAGVFSAFQAIMPMTGWICVHTLVQYFTKFEKFIPWITLVLLLCIGFCLKTIYFFIFIHIERSDKRKYNNCKQTKITNYTYFATPNIK